MRGSPFKGRSVLALAALAAALVVPAAVSAAGADHGRLTPSVSLPSPSSTGATGGQSPDIFLVQLSAGADTFRKQAKAVGLEVHGALRLQESVQGRVGAHLLRVTSASSPASASVSSRIHPAHYYTLGPEPAADPELATAIEMTGADIAQAEGHTGAGVKVAVMDTGIDVDHPDLGGDGNSAAPHSFPNSRIIGGWDFVGDAYNADPRAPVTTRAESRHRSPTTATVTVRTSPESSAPTRHPAPTGASALRPGQLRRISRLRMRRLGHRDMMSLRWSASGGRHGRSQHVHRRRLQQWAGTPTAPPQTPSSTRASSSSRRSATAGPGIYPPAPPASATR